MDAINLITSLIAQRNIAEQKFLSDRGFNRTLLSDWKSEKCKSYKKYIGEYDECKCVGRVIGVLDKGWIVE